MLDGGAHEGSAQEAADDGGAPARGRQPTAATSPSVGQKAVDARALVTATEAYSSGLTVSQVAVEERPRLGSLTNSYTLMGRARTGVTREVCVSRCTQGAIKTME